MEIKAALVPQHHLEVENELVARAHKPATSMQLIRQLSGNHAYPYTVCRYKGVTYVGLENGAINKVDNIGNNTANFIKLSKRVLTVRGHMDQLFILEFGQPYKMHVYDLNGRLVKSWNHTDFNGGSEGNKLFVYKNEVFVADTINQQIVIYDLDGKLKQNIPCPTMQKTCTSMCPAGKDCVIITSFIPPQVSKINFKTGDVVWSTRLARTYGLFSSTCVGQSLLVGLNGYQESRGVWIDVLNAENGECF